MERSVEKPPLLQFLIGTLDLEDTDMHFYEEATQDAHVSVKNYDELTGVSA